MTHSIESEIKGRGFLKTYLLFFIPILICAVASDRLDETTPFLSTVFSLGESYLSMLLTFSFICYAVPFILFREKSLLFKGTLSEYAPKALKWFLLTVITLGLYSPWMIRNIANYYLNRTEYEGNQGEFLGNPGTLLKYMLLYLYLPILVLGSLFGIYMFRNFYGLEEFIWYEIAGPSVVFAFIMIIAMIPFIYFYLSWIIDFSFGERSIRFNRNFSETAAFLLPQIGLSLITLGIYWPAATVKIYRFLLEGSSHSGQSEGSSRGFSFEKGAAEGFGLIWVQVLLTLITVGIYGPWAMAKVTNWFLNSTCIEEKI